MEQRIVIFAYGSNMCETRLRQRVPSARAIGIGYLRGHILTWDKPSQDGSCKCNVRCTDIEADTVWGVLFEIDRFEKRALDQAEGLGHGYSEKEVSIISGGAARSAQIYFAADKVNTEHKPYDWYKAFVVTGAREHNLPEEYISCLECVASLADANEGRARKNLKLLSGC